MMPEFIKKMQQNITAFWKNLDKSLKHRIYITTGVLIVFIILGIVFLAKPNYIAVVSSDDAKEINEMRSILADNNIEHKLSSDKTSILVNAKDKNKAELALAVEGYPKGGMTFEDAWSQIKINSTESDKKKLWEEYKKNSLIAKLKMFDNVKDADVELALPEESLFSNEQKPSAYVRITPKEPLTREQVEGIVMVVARSVENLDPSNITVVDNYANILNNDVENQVTFKTNTQEEMRQKKALELEQRVYKLLGISSDSYDTLKVVANPVLDFNVEKSVTQKLIGPDGSKEGFIISREIKSESSENTTQGGAPGMDTNPGTVDSNTYQYSNGGNSSSESESTVENFDYTRSTIEQEKALGTLDAKSSSMSVALWYGNKVKDDSKLTDEFIRQLVQDVSMATGIPASNISVSKYKLAPVEVEVKTGFDKFKDFIDDYGFYLVMLVLALGLVLALIIGRRRSDNADGLLAAGVGEGNLASANEAVGANVDVVVGETLPEISLEEKSEVKKQIENFVKKKPDAVAQLLRNWLMEDWE